jgi:hypothetical protein
VSGDPRPAERVGFVDGVETFDGGLCGGVPASARGLFGIEGASHFQKYMAPYRPKRLILWGAISR